MGPARGKGEGEGIPRIVSTPIAPLVLPPGPGKPRRAEPDEIAAALARLGAETPDSEFKAWVLDWLAPAYRPQTSLADACAAALHALLGPRGLVVLRAHAREAKLAAAPWILKGLPVTLPDGHTPVLAEASHGRDP